MAYIAYPSSFSQLQYDIDHQLFRIGQNTVYLFCLVSLLRKYYIVIQYCKCKDSIKKIKLPVFNYLVLLSLIIIVIVVPVLSELQKKYYTSVQWCIHSKLVQVNSPISSLVSSAPVVLFCSIKIIVYFLM
jgi:heme/copper-type cytochrome/quinol oxidase subunit 1